MEESILTVERESACSTEDFEGEILGVLTDAGWPVSKAFAKEAAETSFSAKSALTSVLGAGLKLTAEMSPSLQAVKELMSRSVHYRILSESHKRFSPEEVLSGKHMNKRGQAEKIGKSVTGSVMLKAWNELRGEVSGLSGRLVISARPRDLLTAATWSQFSTCHRIITSTPGEHASGVISYMLDGNTAISYMYNPMDPVHVRDKYPYKLWRQMLYFPQPLGLAVFSRQYPVDRVMLATLTRRIVMRSMGAHLGFSPPQWKVLEGLIYTGYKREGAVVYLDEGHWRTAYLKGLVVPKEVSQKTLDPFVSSYAGAPYKVQFVPPLCIHCCAVNTVSTLLCPNCANERSKCRAVTNNPIHLPAPKMPAPNTKIPPRRNGEEEEDE